MSLRPSVNFLIQNSTLSQIYFEKPRVFDFIREYPLRTQRTRKATRSFEVIIDTYT